MAAHGSGACIYSMHLCVCCVCVWFYGGSTYMCTCIWRLVLLSHSPSYSLKQCISLNLELTHWVSLADQCAPKIHLAPHTWHSQTRLLQIHDRFCFVLFCFPGSWDLNSGHSKHVINCTWNMCFWQDHCCNHDRWDCEPHISLPCSCSAPRKVDWVLPVCSPLCLLRALDCSEEHSRQTFLSCQPTPK